MATYAVGDIQGCYDELQLLLERIGFDTASDRMWFVGDLVNRGPKSLQVLRLVKELGDAAVCVLGNHDLHLLAIALSSDPPPPEDDLRATLAAPDLGEICTWLRHRPLAHFDSELDTLMVHAGVVPDWTASDVVQLAAEVEAILQGPDHADFLQAMYGNKPKRWSAELKGIERQRFIVNCLTRIRYCKQNGELDLKAKFGPGKHPATLIPWFELPNRQSANTRIVFGHWSTLGYHVDANVLALDTGCVWGGPLTAVRLDTDAAPIQITSLQAKRFD